MRKINITETLKAINFVTSVGMEDEVKAMANLVAKSLMFEKLVFSLLQDALAR